MNAALSLAEPSAVAHRNAGATAARPQFDPTHVRQSLLAPLASLVLAYGEGADSSDEFTAAYRRALATAEFIAPARTLWRDLRDACDVSKRKGMALSLLADAYLAVGVLRELRDSAERVEACNLHGHGGPLAVTAGASATNFAALATQAATAASVLRALASTLPVPEVRKVMHAVEMKLATLSQATTQAAEAHRELAAAALRLSLRPLTVG